MQQEDSALDKFYRGALSVYIFVLVLLLYFGTNNPTIDVKYLFSAWAALVLTGSFIVIAWITKKPLRRPPVFGALLSALVILLFFRSLYSEFRAISLLETSRFLVPIALYWLTSQVFHKSDQVLRFFCAFACAMAIAAIYALLQAAGLDPFPWTDTTSDTYTNLPATFGNPNFAAHAIILSIIMVFGAYAMERRWTLWLLPLLFFHLYRTDQRAGWIALAGAAVLVGVGYGCLCKSTTRPTGRIVAAVLLVGTVGVGAVGGIMLVTYLRTGFAFPLDLSLLIRYQSYVSATDMLLDAPLLGHGPAVYGLAYAPYWTAFEQDWFAQELRMNAHVHNDLLELAIDGGLGAAALYLVTLVLGICYGLLLAARSGTTNQRRLGYVFAALFTAFAIDGLFGFNLRVPVTTALFFILLGLLDGLWSGDAVKVNSARTWPSHVFRVVLLVAILLSTRLETKSFASEYHFSIGMRAHSVGKFEEARAAYERAEAAAPWSYHAARRIAMTYVDEGNPALSAPHFDRAMALNPHYLLARLPMAQASLVSAQEALRDGAAGVDAAREHLNEAREDATYLLEFSPNFPAAHTTLGRIESIAAIIERDFSTPPDPGQVEAHWNLARDHLNDAIERGARNAGELYCMLMHVHVGLNDLQGAEAALVGAVQANDDYLDRAWSLYFNIATETGKFDTMRGVLYRQIEVLQQKMTQEEDTETVNALVTAYTWLATVQMEGFQDSKRALDAMAQALHYAPLRSDLWSRCAALALANDGQARLEQIIRDSCTALVAERVEPLPQVEAVRLVLEREENLELACRSLLAAVRSVAPDTTPNAKDTYSWAVQLLLGHYHALATETGAPPCASALDLGIACVGVESYATAADLLNRASNCLEDNRKAIARIHWADVMVRQGKAEEALPVLEASLVEFPEHLDTQWAIARTLVTLGRFNDAQVRYDGLLSGAQLPPEAMKQLEAERARLPVAP